jgi:hypothetical protein
VVLFTEAEWAAFKVTNLRASHFIRVGNEYYRPADWLLQQFVDFAMLSRKSEIGHALVCSRFLGDDTSTACLAGSCLRCGFKRLWSRGLRSRILKKNAEGEEELINGVDPLWGHQLTWDTLKPGGDEPHGSTGDDLRFSVTGTVTAFLDCFEAVQDNWTPHRFHTVQAKMAERELEQNMTPAQVKDDSDWSENGEIVLKDQMQAEYWHTKYYSLLISITCFLSSFFWKVGPPTSIHTLPPSGIVTCRSTPTPTGILTLPPPPRGIVPCRTGRVRCRPRRR